MFRQLIEPGVIDVNREPLDARIERSSTAVPRGFQQGLEHAAHTVGLS